MVDTPTSTVWVLTVPTSDDQTIHAVVESMAEGARLVATIAERMGYVPEHSLVEVPRTWACDGRDGCTAIA